MTNISSALACDQYGNRENYKVQLQAIKAACSKIVDWKNETLCLGVGIDAVTNQQEHTTFTPKICEKARTWIDEVKCFRSMIDSLGDNHAKRVMQLCDKMDGWKNRAVCFRDYFSDLK